MQGFFVTQDMGGPNLPMEIANQIRSVSLEP